MFKPLFLALALCPLISANPNANSNPMVYVTVDSDSVSSIQKNLAPDTKPIVQRGGIALLRLPEADLLKLSDLMHEEFHRCGGFMVHESVQDGSRVVLEAPDWKRYSRSLDAGYELNQSASVEALLPKLEETKIRSVIEHLSAYKNRFYKSKTGVEAAEWIRSKWADTIKNVPGAKAETFTHKAFPQPSVIATLPGKNPDEVVILGGHLDSIAGYFGGDTPAPGADDNASGIGTLTEVLRVFAESGIKPARTVQFMGYAAEELGLLGSAEIAKSYRTQNKNVVGVLQLDMTNYKGSEKPVYLMDDYTNAAQNRYLGQLIDRYVKIPWGTSTCGYGCSDHASWHRHGYAASIPFESKMEEYNPHIHSPKDTIHQSGGDASHALNFARIALAYLVETAK